MSGSIGGCELFLVLIGFVFWFGVFWTNVRFCGLFVQI